MNYRHAFHAGNFADVVKHIILVRSLEYLKKKDTPFRVIDTHAGIGVYDLKSEAAQKTDEWRAGIAKLQNATLSPPVISLLEPYFDAIAAENPTGTLRFYPGSPKLVSHLLRPMDHFIANELHEEDAELLRHAIARSRQVKVMSLDGWTLLKAVLPPKERRGITLVDPPFEQSGEFDRLVQAAVEHQRRFATGVLMLWFPIKDRKRVHAFYTQISALKIDSCLLCEFAIDQIFDAGAVRAAGVMVINPPYALHNELRLVLPEVCTTLALSRHASYELKWLVRT